MHTKHKKASIYIFALAAAMVLVSLVVGLSAIIMQFRRSSRTNTQIDRAKIYAELGIRHALYFTSIEPNWRSLLQNGTWLQDIPIDNATYTVTGIDPDDGDLLDGDEFTIELTCTATIDRTQQTLSVLAQNHPSELLKYAVAAGGNIIIANQVHINGDVSTNANFSKTGAGTLVNGNVEAVGTIKDTTNITGIIAPGSDPKSFPDNQAIIDFYLNQATPIPFQNLIEKVLITPNSNPFGPTNPDGIYVIDCANQKIQIQDCRIVGTLILINPAVDSTVEASVNWRPARPNLPALIIDGGGLIIQPKIDLDEAQVGADFDLPGQPSFGDTNNVFPNLIQGTIYCNGDLTLDESTIIHGPVISTGTLQLTKNSVVTADPLFFNNPPKMFMDSQLDLIPNTWR